MYKYMVLSHLISLLIVIIQWLNIRKVEIAIESLLYSDWILEKKFEIAIESLLYSDWILEKSLKVLLNRYYTVIEY